jgi:hypothetical protein
LIHRTGHSDSIIAEFPWPGRSSGTFATKSATTSREQMQQTRNNWGDRHRLCSASLQVK